MSPLFSQSHRCETHEQGGDQEALVCFADVRNDEQANALLNVGGIVGALSLESDDQTYRINKPVIASRVSGVATQSFWFGSQ